MKPPALVYHAAESVEEAVASLVEAGDEGKVLAGGQSLIPVMNMRLARPSVLVDIRGIRDLDHITANGELRIGATVTQANVRVDRQVAAHAPIVGAALDHVGHAANRNRGTFGGSIAHADPAAELPAVLLALRGSVVVQGAAGQRDIPADELFVTYLSTDLGSDEVLTEVRLPAAPDPGRRAWGFTEVARRHGDFALAGVALVADLDDGGCVDAASIALFGVSDVPHRASAAEEALIGGRLDDADRLAAVAAAASDGLEPPSDVHATAEYRRHAVGVLVRRALEQAATRREAQQ